jgi:RNA polymerase sigma-70 factor, ECF subfamily
VPDEVDPFARAYDAIRADAARIARLGGGVHSATTLVHEAWLRLSDSDAGFESERHFRAVAAMAMRQVLVDLARRRLSSKRGGDAVRVTLTGVAAEESEVDPVDLDRAFTALEARSPRQHEIALLRVLGGLTVEEIAAELDVSERTVAREWKVASLWLRHAMSDEGG